MPWSPQVTSKEEQIMEARIDRRKLGIILGGAVAVLFAGVSIVDADPNPPTYAATPAVSFAYQSELVAWANANGMSGLSPAGLSVVPARSAGQAEVAAWAAASGLRGLSPASLGRIDD
jgi:hypothetical protein